MFPTVHPSTLRPTLCWNGRLLGFPGGDGTRSRPQLHSHSLSQAEPSRPCQSGVCRVSYHPIWPLVPPWINGFIYKSLDIHVDRANSGPSVNDAPECIRTNLWLDWIALQSVAYQTGGFDVFITVERKSCDSAISFPVFLQSDTFVYSFLLLRNINMPDLNVNGEDITSYF